MKKDEQEKQRIINTFENHIIRDHQVIFRAGSPRVEVMTFGDKNGSLNCRIDYMIRNGALAVYGDLGESIYRWYGEISLEWIATCDLGYFHGKCEASSEGDGGGQGARPHDWDGDQAKTEIMDSLRERIKDGSIPTTYYKDTTGAKHELEMCLESCHNQQEFCSYCQREDPALAFKDNDWWEWLPSIGEIVPIRIRMHLIGLKMAFNKKIGRYT